MDIPDSHRRADESGIAFPMGAGIPADRFMVRVRT